jgi:hypothetical protein
LRSSVWGGGAPYTLGDGVEKVLSGPVGVLAGNAVGLLLREGLNALLGLEVELDPVLLALLVDELEGMARVAVHVAVVLGDAAVGEEDGDLVNALGGKRKEVPEHVGILEIGLGVPLLRVDEICGRRGALIFCCNLEFMSASSKMCKE